MRRRWNDLPPNMRTTAKNLSTIRIGVACMLVLIVVGLANAVASKTPAEFIDWIVGLNALAAIAGLTLGTVVLVIRAMRTAPRFIEAYGEIMPDRAEDIAASFSERGAGDVVAPWIRSPDGRWSRIGRYLANRFRLLP